MYSPKQLAEAVDLFSAHQDNPMPIDIHTAIKPYAELGHVLIRSDLAGCEGEIVVSRDSLETLGQLLVAIARRDGAKQERERVSKG